jgi:Holliday junction resolvase RusA-like endonuclease
VTIKDQLVTDELRFVVFGRSQGKGSKRVLPHRHSGRVVLVDSNKNARPWANQVARAAVAAMEADRRSRLMRGAVAVRVTFCFARPKGHFGTGRNLGKLVPSAPQHMTTMPDLDKLARCTLDALTGTVLADDSQIADLRARKVYSEPERCEVVVHAL